MVLTGYFEVVGDLEDHTLYANAEPDGNGNYWFFYFENDLKVWKFSYSATIPKPGDDVLGHIVTYYDSTKPG